MAGHSRQPSLLDSSRGALNDKTAIGRTIKKKFERVGCPHTESADETWIAELVFHPGESRLRILHWLFSKFHKKLYNMLDPAYHQGSSAETRLQRMLFVASNLGLCRPNDIDLIKGNTSLGKQMAFIDQLLDLVIIIDASEDPEKHVLRSPGKINESTQLDEQFVNDCRIIDCYCSQGHCSELDRYDIDLLPLDISKMIDKAQQGKLAENALALPDAEKLKQMASYLAEDIARQSDCLRQMEHHIEDTDPHLRQKVIRMLKLVLSELQQMLTTFSYTYENDVEPWCVKSASVQPIELGPKFRHVHNMTESLASTLECLNTIRSTTAHIQQLSTQLPSAQDQQDMEYVDSLKRSLKVLDASKVKD